MWGSLVFLGVRYVLGSTVGIVSWTAAISAISVYGRERQIDGGTIAVAVASFFVAAGLWPDVDYRKELQERLTSEQRRPSFWLLPMLGAAVTGLTLLCAAAAFVVVSQRDSIAQLETDLLDTRTELTTEQTAGAYLLANLCQAADDQIACQLNIRQEARAWALTRP